MKIQDDNFDLEGSNFASAKEQYQTNGHFTHVSLLQTENGHCVKKSKYQSKLDFYKTKVNEFDTKMSNCEYNDKETEEWELSDPYDTEGECD